MDDDPWPRTIEGYPYERKWGFGPPNPHIEVNVILDGSGSFFLLLSKEDIGSSS